MNGKGDSPRNCFSEEYRTNYDSIDWSNSKKRNKQLRKQHVNDDVSENENYTCDRLNCDCNHKS